MDLSADVYRARASAPISTSAGRASSPPAGAAGKRRSRRSRSRGSPTFSPPARQHYAFEPARISEREFKRRYAEEAIALGLTKEQVVRVYALETGGDGTADMQAGINPITKKGKPISSALGYAQLLHANTIGELVKHGDGFVKRLQRLKAGAQRSGPRRTSCTARSPRCSA